MLSLYPAYIQCADHIDVDAHWSIITGKLCCNLNVIGKQ